MVLEYIEAMEYINKRIFSFGSNTHEYSSSIAERVSCFSKSPRPTNSRYINNRGDTLLAMNEII